MSFKYRLIVQQCDTEKQIISIEEKSDGTIILLFPVHPFMAFYDVVLNNIINNKFTIHLSENSNPAGNTITHEILFKDGKFHRSHAHIINNDEGHLIWPLFTKSLGYDEIKYNRRPRHLKDKLHYLLPYNAKNQLMIISVVAFDTNVPKIAIHPLSCVHLKLSKFSLAVYYRIGQIPSYRNSLYRVGHTSPVLGIGSDISNAELTKQASLNAEQLATYLQDDFDYIINWNVSKADHPTRQ